MVDAANSVVLVAAVNGSLLALTCHGEKLWQCSLGAHIYAPLCLVYEQHATPSTIAANINAVVVGTDKGNLHCIDCLSGRQLCESFVQPGTSTAAAVLSNSLSSSGPQEAGDKQMQPIPMGNGVQSQFATADQSKLLVTCTNSGAVRLAKAALDASNTPRTQSVDGSDGAAGLITCKPASMDVLAAIQLPGEPARTYSCTWCALAQNRHHYAMCTDAVPVSSHDKLRSCSLAMKHCACAAPQRVQRPWPRAAFLLHK